MKMSLLFWEINNLNTIADEGITNNTVEKMTQVINGGFNHLEERISSTKTLFNNLKK